MTDRPQGILTPDQRAFIRMDPEERRAAYDRRVRYEYRRRIQDRVENALVDFRVLHELDRTDDHNVVAEAFSGGDDGAGIDAGAYVPSAVKFFARALDRENAPLYSGSDVPVAYDELLSAVEKGIERDAAERKDTVLSVSVSVEVSEESVDDLIEQLKADEPATPEKLRLVALLQEVGVDDDRLAEVAPEVVLGSPDPNCERKGIEKRDTRWDTSRNGELPHLPRGYTRGYTNTGAYTTTLIGGTLIRGGVHQLLSVVSPVDVGLRVPRESRNPRLALTALLQLLCRHSEFPVNVADELVVEPRRSGELLLAGLDNFDACASVRLGVCYLLHRITV